MPVPSQIPFGYGERVVAVMTKNSYDNLDSFLDDFLPICREHKNSSNKMRDVMFFFNFAHVPEEPQFGRTKKDRSDRDIKAKHFVPEVSARREFKPSRLASLEATGEDQLGSDPEEEQLCTSDAFLAAVSKEKQSKSSLPCFSKLFKKACPTRETLIQESGARTIMTMLFWRSIMRFICSSFKIPRTIASCYI
jgi:hypothetical protein